MVELARKPTGGGDLRSLLATRRGTLLIAGVCAIVAALVLVFAINRYRQTVTSSNKQDTVLVASGLIQKGTSGTAIATSQLYSPTSIVEKHLSVGAISDAATLRGKVAVTDILPGQQLTAADFAVGSGVANQLASNERAVEVQLDASHGLGGVLRAGDRVDVYGGFNVQQSGTGAAGGGPLMRLLVPGVLVLQSSGTGGNVGGGNTNVLLAVNENQAPAVAFAADNGKIWLALRPGNSQNPSAVPTTLGAILAGIPPVATNPTPGGKKK